MHSSQHGVKIKTNYKTEFSESRTIKEKYKSPQQEMVRSSIWLSATLHSRMDRADLAVVPREKAHTGAAAREQPQDSPVIAR